jgi:hypothetical protein
MGGFRNHEGRSVRRERHRYELRMGGATVKSGLLAEISEFQVGDRLEVDGSAGIIRALEPVPGEPKPRLILELLPRGA